MMKKILLGLCALVCANFLFAENIIFRVGTPDSSGKEFKSFGSLSQLRFYPNVNDAPTVLAKKEYAEPITWEIGKKFDEDFPYAYPLLNCLWAPKGSQVLKFIFNLDKAPEKDLYFKVGYADSSTQYVEVFAEANAPVTTESASKQMIAYMSQDFLGMMFGTLLYHPDSWGVGLTSVFKIEASKLKQGENVIEFLAKSSHPYGNHGQPMWFVFDYIELSDTPEATPQPSPYEEEKAKALASIGDTEIVFATRSMSMPEHWYANIGWRAQVKTGDADRDRNFGQRVNSTDSGRLVKYNPKTKETIILLEDIDGAVRDPFVSYDAKKILFSYRPAGSKFYNLYEINADGSDMKKLPIGGDWDDIEPCYLPNGDIVFISSRCNRMVPCWASDVAILHRYFIDEKVVRPISSNVDQDNTPWVMPDGKLMYMKWDYVQRSQMVFHHLWKKAPDGSNDAAYFGNEIPGHVFLEPKPIPGTSSILFNLNEGHGAPEHAGNVARLNEPKNPSDLSALEFISGDMPTGFFAPFPIDDKYILVSVGRQIILMDREGHMFTDVFDTPKEFWYDKKGTVYGTRMMEPRLLRPTKLPAQIADAADWDEKDATVVLMDASIGRKMAGVKQGEVKKLMIVEILPASVHMTGGMDPFTLTGTFSIEQVLGTVNVEEDGSAHFKVPARRALSFVSLDENNRAIKRMQSFMDFSPGTTTSCIGCHEQRDMAPPKTQTILAALKRPAEEIKPLDGIDFVIDYPTHIQPIWDKYCISCHNPDKLAADLDLSGDFGPMYILSYFHLRTHGAIIDGGNAFGNMDPRTFGTGGSPLVDKISGEHNNVKLTDEEKRLVYAWLDMGALHASTYAAAQTGQFGPQIFNYIIAPDEKWEEREDYMKVLESSCYECHKPDDRKMFLPTIISGEKEPKESPPWVWVHTHRKGDLRNKLSHFVVFNLTRPEKSTILTTPLAKEAGGKAESGAHKVIFKDKNDPRYLTILAYLQRAKDHLYNDNPHYSMPNYKHSYAYTYYLKKYGIIKDENDPRHPFILDRLYWNDVTGLKEWKASEE